MCYVCILSHSHLTCASSSYRSLSEGNCHQGCSHIMSLLPPPLLFLTGFSLAPLFLQHLLVLIFWTPRYLWEHSALRYLLALLSFRVCPLVLRPSIIARLDDPIEFNQSKHDNGRMAHSQSPRPLHQILPPLCQTCRRQAAQHTIAICSTKSVTQLWHHLFSPTNLSST